jgi:hypothetical protein
MAKDCAHAYVRSRAALGFPLLPSAIGAAATAAYTAEKDGVNAGAIAAGRVAAGHAKELGHAG